MTAPGLGNSFLLIIKFFFYTVFACHFKSRPMKKFLAFLLLATALRMAAQPDSIEWANDDTAQRADTELNVEEMDGVTSTAPEQIAPPSPGTTERPARELGWLVLACGLATLLAVGSGVMAYMARREVADLHESYNSALEQTNNDMRRLAEESAREVNALRAQLARLTGQLTAARATISHKPPVHPDTTTGSGTVTPHGPQTLYLAKPDSQGRFTRSSTGFELGNSLFELTTTDGVHGTFIVVDNADAHRFALMMPTENLTNACSGEAIQLSAGKTRIVTDQPGSALLDNGSWQVVQKAVIHYE